MKPKLEYFSHGPFVVEAQTKLNALMPGAQPPLKVDGKYGDGTVARVKQFQKSRGLVADGVVGAKTWAALDGTAATAPPGPTVPPQLPDVHLKGKPVHFGARMKCTLGSKSAGLMLMMSPTKPATVGDCQPYLNIPAFGNCQSDVNPSYLAKTTYEDSMLGASYTYGSGWRPYCTPALMSPWIGAFTKNGPIDKAQTLDKTARCSCKYGGTIYFT